MEGGRAGWQRRCARVSGGGRAHGDSPTRGEPPSRKGGRDKESGGSGATHRGRQRTGIPGRPRDGAGGRRSVRVGVRVSELRSRAVMRACQPGARITIRLPPSRETVGLTQERTRTPAPCSSLPRRANGRDVAACWAVSGPAGRCWATTYAGTLLGLYVRTKYSYDISPGDN